MLHVRFKHFSLSELSAAESTQCFVGDVIMFLLSQAVNNKYNTVRRVYSQKTQIFWHKCGSHLQLDSACHRSTLYGRCQVCLYHIYTLHFFGICVQLLANTNIYSAGHMAVRLGIRAWSSRPAEALTGRFPQPSLRFKQNSPPKEGGYTQWAAITPSLLVSFIYPGKVSLRWNSNSNI